MAVLMVYATPVPDGVSSSAFWRKLGWGSPRSPFVWAVGLGYGLWLPHCLDSKNQAAIEQRAVGVKVDCPLVPS